MQNIILMTPEQQEDLINRCLSKHISAPKPEPKPESKSVRHIHSIKKLAEFLGCSVVSAQKLKNSGKVRYRQFGRKLIFVESEVLEDIEKSGRRTSK